MAAGSFFSHFVLFVTGIDLVKTLTKVALRSLISRAQLVTVCSLIESQKGQTRLLLPGAADTLITRLRAPLISLLYRHLDDGERRHSALYRTGDIVKTIISQY